MLGLSSMDQIPIEVDAGRSLHRHTHLFNSPQTRMLGTIRTLDNNIRCRVRLGDLRVWLDDNRCVDIIHATSKLLVASFTETNARQSKQASVAVVLDRHWNELHKRKSDSAALHADIDNKLDHTKANDNELDITQSDGGEFVPMDEDDDREAFVRRGVAMIEHHNKRINELKSMQSLPVKFKATSRSVRVRLEAGAPTFVNGLFPVPLVWCPAQNSVERKRVFRRSMPVSVPALFMFGKAASYRFDLIQNRWTKLSISMPSSAYAAYAPKRGRIDVLCFDDADGDRQSVPCGNITVCFVYQRDGRSFASRHNILPFQPTLVSHVLCTPRDHFHWSFGLAFRHNQIFVLGETPICRRSCVVATVPPQDERHRFAPQPMIIVRTACGAAVLEGRVWVVGGYVNHMHIGDVEFLDLASNTWHRGPYLNVPRANCGVVALGGTLYVFGGENAEGVVCSVERLDGDEWTLLSDTRVPNSVAVPSVGACVVYE